MLLIGKIYLTFNFIYIKLVFKIASMRSLALVLWLLLGLIYFGVWSCNKNECCPDTTISNLKLEESSNLQSENLVSEKPYISFIYSSDSAIANSRLHFYLDSIKNSIANKATKIEITGLYRASETNSSNYDNLGIARANAVKFLLEKSIDPNLIVLKSQLLSDSLLLSSAPFVSHSISIVLPTVEEFDHKAIIHHSSNSTQWDKDPELMIYLSKLVERLSKGGKIAITGHTDDIGKDESNYVLGLSRAKEIKRFLVSKGINTSQISIDSKGESMPIDLNDTEEGRFKNRRTEIEYIN